MEDFRWFRTQRLTRLYLWTDIDWETYIHQINLTWFGGEDE